MAQPFDGMWDWDGMSPMPRLGTPGPMPGFLSLSRMSRALGIGLTIMGGILALLVCAGGVGGTPPPVVGVGLLIAALYGVPGLILIWCADAMSAGRTGPVFTLIVVAVMSGLLMLAVGAVTGVEAVRSGLVWGTPVIQAITHLFFGALLARMVIRAGGVLLAPESRGGEVLCLAVNGDWDEAGERRACVAAGAAAIVLHVLLCLAGAWCWAQAIRPVVSEVPAGAPPVRPELLQLFSADDFFAKQGLPKQEREAVISAFASVGELREEHRRDLDCILREVGGEIFKGKPRPLTRTAVQGAIKEALHGRAGGRDWIRGGVELPGGSVRLMGDHRLAAGEPYVEYHPRGRGWVYVKNGLAWYEHEGRWPAYRLERWLREAAVAAPLTVGQAKTLEELLQRQRSQRAEDSTYRYRDALPAQGVSADESGAIRVTMFGDKPIWIGRGGETFRTSPGELRRREEAERLRRAKLRMLGVWPPLAAAPCLACAGAVAAGVWVLAKGRRGVSRERRRRAAGWLAAASVAVAVTWVGLGAACLGDGGGAGRRLVQGMLNPLLITSVICGFPVLLVSGIWLPLKIGRRGKATGA